MSPVRFVSLTLLLGLGFTLLPVRALAQLDDKDPVGHKPPEYREVTRYKSEGLPPGKVEEAKPKFVGYAKYTVDAVSYSKRYTAVLDPTIQVPDNATMDGSGGLLPDLERQIIIPVPPNKYGTERADYIRELGQALDDALKDVIFKHPEPIVRVNATRMLAVACKSGAHAHYPTVITLITKPSVKIGDVEVPIRPEVKYYALLAAGNLLTAYNLEAYNPIQGAYLDRRHSHNEENVGALVAALEKAVLDPGSLLDIPPKADGTPGELAPDQKTVAMFFRRQAVRALGQARYAVLPGPNKTFLYPAHVLARIAVSDPSLIAPPRADEIAEAVIGICNMDPPDREGEKKVYAVGAAEVIATGVLTYGGDSVANPPDKTVPWKGGALRMLEAISRWRARFDATIRPQVLNNPSFDPDRPGAFNADAYPQVGAVYDRARKLILDPIANRTAQINVEGMRTFLLQEVRKGTEQEKTITLYGNPKLTVPRK